jgi:hypothetical protein
LLITKNILVYASNKKLIRDISNNKFECPDIAGIVVNLDPGPETIKVNDTEEAVLPVSPQSEKNTLVRMIKKKKITISKLHIV